MPETAPIVNGHKLDWVRSTDPRNENYLLAAVVPPGPAPSRKVWQAPFLHTNQGQTGHCTCFGLLNTRMHTSTTWDRFRPSPNTDAGANALAHSWFPQTQALDEFADTPPADGSSVNGAMRCGREVGVVTSWHWGRSVDEARLTLLTKGPVEWGSIWPNSMFTYDRRFRVRLDESEGGLDQGHAFCLDGWESDYYDESGAWAWQSWGSWGKDPGGLGRGGRFFMPERTVLRPLWEMGAEFALATAG